MTEREKMLAGQLYNPGDLELSQLHQRAGKLCRLYNATPVEDENTLGRLCASLLGGIGDGFWLEPPIFFDYGQNTFIGEGFYANTGLVILDCARVTIGSRVMFGPRVQIYTASHPLHPQLRRQGLEYAKPVSIGDDVWIGGGALIMPGVTIGSGTGVGGGSGGTRGLPANVIAVGNPCRVLRAVTPEDLKEFDR